MDGKSLQAFENFRWVLTPIQRLLMIV
jgi:hypothetical protein